MFNRAARPERAARRPASVHVENLNSPKPVRIWKRHPSTYIKPTGPSHALQAVKATTTTYPAEVKLDSTAEPTPSSAAPAAKQFKLCTSVCCLPHPDKAHYGGEDAYFTSEVGGGAFGLADGVGGWADSGVNPAEYSRSIMKIAHAFIEGRDLMSVVPTPRIARESIGGGSSASPRFKGAPPKLPANGIDPRGALEAGHILTRLPGSTTACVVQLDKSAGTLVAANLGDSGFIVLRNGQVVLQTRPLEHYFDCPLQFGAYPEFVEATDTAADADVYNFPVQAGDIIIGGTDGLWDNAYLTEIVSLVPKEATESAIALSAAAIAALARKHASDTDFDSPYIKEAMTHGFDLPWWEKLFGASFRNGRFHLKKFTGGKMDDITVIVAMVAIEEAKEQAHTEAVSQAEAAAAPAAVLETAASGAPAAEAAAPAALAARVVNNVDSVHRAVADAKRLLQRQETPLIPNMGAAATRPSA